MGDKKTTNKSSKSLLRPQSVPGKWCEKCDKAYDYKVENRCKCFNPSLKNQAVG